METWQIVAWVIVCLILSAWSVSRLIGWLDREIMGFTGDDLGMMEQDDDDGNIAIGGRHEHWG